jgi:SP family general alpha glucoside:H+ symporter-like MFS transporter
MSYSTYFFTQAGLPTSSAFSLSMGQYAINTGGTIVAWGLMALGIGRR